MWGPSRMSWEDAPSEAVALLAGIAWHVEVSLDGSGAGLERVMRALRAMATAGHGVIADDRHVWRPGSNRRTRWSIPPSRLESETEWLTMMWWTLDSSLTTLPGTTRSFRLSSGCFPRLCQCVGATSSRSRSVSNARA